MPVGYDTKKKRQVWISAEVAEKVKALAEREGRSVNKQVEQILKQHLKRGK